MILRSDWATQTIPSQNFSRYMSKNLPTTNNYHMLPFFQESQAGPKKFGLLIWQLMMTHLPMRLVPVSCSERKNSMQVEIHGILAIMSLSLSLFFLSLCGQSTSVSNSYWANQSKAAMHTLLIIRLPEQLSFHTGWFIGIPLSDFISPISWVL